ncbi:hypothetical protein J3R30DRAFT_3694895 [Lentinula aciculospora]|uniref:Uncharacterized protein n=1 Tax=Lentinula aciculospora TaxID=153920 RepID=A0A9W9AUM3_9AGAR|nr:hypothetical protein J3R30DRAFT_3694895 [Lentinula aciculospora]
MSLPTNITIDDTDSSFTWQSAWIAAPCDYCSALLNQSLTYDGTWHDGGVHTGLMAAFDFNGTAVYLFGATSQNDTGTIEFTLDGNNATTYVPPVIAADDPSIGTPEADHIYNSLFFVATGLQDGSHQLGFTTVMASNSSQTVLIDYAIVTNNNSTDISTGSGSGSGANPSSNGSESGGSTNTSSGSTNKAALIGGIVGGVVGLVLLSLAIFFFLRWRKSRVCPIKPENDIRPLRIAPSFITGRSHSLNTASTLSSHPKARQPLPTISTPSPTETYGPSVHVQDYAVSTPSTQLRSDSGAATTNTEPTNTRSRQEIQKMEQRIRSLESMVLFNHHTAVTSPTVHHASTTMSSIMSPMSEQTYGASMDDLTNPPPPY